MPPTTLFPYLIGLLATSVASAQALDPPSLVACPEVPAPPLDSAAAVHMVLQLDAQGTVQAVGDLSGPEALVALAREAVWRCTFAPARQEGATIAVEIPFSWDFPAAPVRVEGQVRAAGTRDPVAGLVLRFGEWSTTTDAEGHFSLRNLPDGSHPVTVVGDRWRLPDTTVSLTEGERLSLDLWVVRQGQLGGDELIALYDVDSGGAVQRSIRSDEIRATPGSLGDPLRALHNRPGFVRTPFDAGWLLVRGGDFDDTGTYLDGIRVPLLYHIGGFTSVLHPEMTETVRFWPGIHPARYQATSGVVDVQSREVGADARVVGGVNTVYAHAFTAVPTRWGGVAIAARRSYLDGILSAVLDPERASIAPRFWDGQARLELGEVSILALGLSDSFEAPTEVAQETVTIRQDGAQVQARIPIAIGAGSLTLSPWAATQRRSLSGDIDSQSILEFYPGFRVEAANAANAPLRWRGGVEAQHRAYRVRLESKDLGTPVETVDPYLSVATGDRMALEMGLRVDTFFVEDHLPRVGPSPRATARWRATNALSFLTGFSRSHGPPLATILIGLPDGAYLDLERADAVSLGLSTSWHGLSFEADAFHRSLANITAFEIDGSVGQLTGFANGVETELHWRTGPWQATALYQYTVSRRREGIDEPTLPSTTDQPHRVDLLLLDELPRNWIVAGRFRYSSGYPRLPDPLAEGQLAPQEAFDLLTQRVRPVALDADALRLRPFHALDLKISKRISFRKWQLDAYLDVQNTYNRRVAEPLITGFGESLPAYGFGLPILPIFGLEGVFYP